MRDNPTKKQEEQDQNNDEQLKEQKQQSKKNQDDEDYQEELPGIDVKKRQIVEKQLDRDQYKYWQNKKKIKQEYYNKINSPDFNHEQFMKLDIDHGLVFSEYVEIPFSGEFSQVPHKNDQISLLDNKKEEFQQLENNKICQKNVQNEKRQYQ